MKETSKRATLSMLKIIQRHARVLESLNEDALGHALDKKLSVKHLIIKFNDSDYQVKLGQQVKQIHKQLEETRRITPNQQAFLLVYYLLNYQAQIKKFHINTVADYQTQLEQDLKAQLTSTLGEAHAIKKAKQLAQARSKQLGRYAKHKQLQQQLDYLDSLLAIGFQEEGQNKQDDFTRGVQALFQELNQSTYEQLSKVNRKIFREYFDGAFDGTLKRQLANFYQLLYDDKKHVDIFWLLNYAQVKAKKTLSPAKQKIINTLIQAISQPIKANGAANDPRFTLQTSIQAYLEQREFTWSMQTVLRLLNPLNWPSELAHWYFDKPLLKKLQQRLVANPATLPDLTCLNEQPDFPKAALNTVIAPSIAYKPITDSQLQHLAAGISDPATAVYTDFEGVKARTQTAINHLSSDQQQQTEAIAQATEIIHLLSVRDYLAACNEQYQHRHLEQTRLESQQVANEYDTLLKQRTDAKKRLTEAQARQDDLAIHEIHGTLSTLDQQIQALKVNVDKLTELEMVAIKKQEHINKINKDPHLKIFFAEILRGVTDNVIALKAIGSSRIQTKADNRQFSSEILQTLGTAGGAVVPGLGLVTAVIGKSYNTLREVHKIKVSQFISKTMPTMREVDNFAYELAIDLTIRYSEQLRKLSLKTDPGILDQITGILNPTIKGEFADNAIQMHAKMTVERIFQTLWIAAEEDLALKLPDDLDYFAYQLRVLNTTDAIVNLDVKLLTQDNSQRISYKGLMRQAGLEINGNRYSAKEGDVATQPEQFGYQISSDQDRKVLKQNGYLITPDESHQISPAKLGHKALKPQHLQLTLDPKHHAAKKIGLSRLNMFSHKNSSPTPIILAFQQLQNKQTQLEDRLKQLENSQTQLGNEQKQIVSEIKK